jgi:hypothetical protein
LIIYFQEVMDWFLDWVPQYIFWKSLAMLVIFSEKELTLKILFSVEIIIVRIESWVDAQISLIRNFSTNFSMPMFTLLLTHSSLMVKGASLDQLKQLEAVCEEYLERIRVAKGKSPKNPIKKL